MAKIAIIEDDAAIAEMYRVKFVKDGHQVETASNGQLGLALIKSYAPDIVLSDIIMPDMTGDAMLRQLRATDWGKDVKVIILTNVSEQEVGAEVHDLGVSAVIVKAKLTPRQVAAVVNEQLGMTQS